MDMMNGNINQRKVRDNEVRAGVVFGLRIAGKGLREREHNHIVSFGLRLYV